MSLVRAIATLLLLAIGLGFGTGARAHEVRPAYLEIAQAAPHQLRVTWRQPIAGELALPLRPRLSSGLLDRAPDSAVREASAMTSVWNVPVVLSDLNGQTLTIDGLRSSITDVLFVVRGPGDASTTRLLRPDAPSAVLDTAARPASPVPAYVGMGVRHIWTGYDHLLFVLALLFLVRDGRKLLATVSAFTVAHSLTLSAAALGVLRVPPAPVEAVIAISIVFVAVEVVRLRQGRPGLSSRYPWVVAFLFGLLHGLGFASALREVGLPQGSVAMALLLFNVGIEIGQVSFVLCALAVLRLVQVWRPALRGRLDAAVPYFAGCLAAFWAFERTFAAFSGS